MGFLADNARRPGDEHGVRGCRNPPILHRTLPRRDLYDSPEAYSVLDVHRLRPWRAVRSSGCLLDYQAPPDAQAGEGSGFVARDDKIHDGSQRMESPSDLNPAATAFRAFFQDVDPIRFREPLAETLGALQSGGAVLEFTVTDVFKIAGRAH